MPDGKPAGVRCVNLTDDNECRVWGTPDYPEVCRRFSAQSWHCGETRGEALLLLEALERETNPSK